MLQAILLGVVQGLTEWIPVSSSGHLVLAQQVFGIEVPLFFDLAIHVATLVVVVLFYRRALLGILRSFLRIVEDRKATPTWRALLLDDPDRRLGVLLVVATVPTAAIGLALRGPIEAAFGSVLAVGVALLVTGTFLWFSERREARRGIGEFGFRDAVVIGTLQGVAIFPGISRSGATIGAALYRGIDRELAARFSFLLSIPAILGATILQATPAAWVHARTYPLEYGVGMLAAGIVGYATLALLVFVIRRRGFRWFAPYCWAVGAAAVAWVFAVP